MRCYFSVACFLSVLFAASLGAPLGGGFSADGSVQGSGNLLAGIDTTQLLQSASRVIGLIRQFCPPLSQVIDNVIQSVTSQLFRVVGRAILQNGGLGGGGSSTNSTGSRVSVVLPTFPPDDDDDDFDDDDDVKDEENIDPRVLSRETTTASEETKTNQSAELTNENEVDSAQGVKNGDAAPLFLSSVADSPALQKRHLAVARTKRAAEAEEAVEEDQDVAESGPQPAEDLSNLGDDADRNKRFLPFGGGHDGHGGGGGSGNFLFDIIRVRERGV